jgi:hypothetical protein
MHRLTEEGQIVHDDFCFTMMEAKSGAEVTTAAFFSKVFILLGSWHKRLSFLSLRDNAW